jgi:hypothetical protein
MAARVDVRMQRPDYVACALRAENEARRTTHPGMAKGWRDLAETYRQLAEQQARNPDDVEHANGITQDIDSGHCM